MFMYDVVEMAERHGRVLARLSELDLAQAEQLHVQALAAEDPKTSAELGLTFHRLARSVRQSIALEARLVRDAARAEREAALEAERLRKAAPRDSVRILQRKAAVQAAVERIIWDEREGEEAETLVDLLEERLEIAALSDDFGLEALEAQVARVCADFGLPLPGGERPQDPRKADEAGEGIEYDAAPPPDKPGGGPDSS
jgi:hypothetical protein